MFTIRPCFSHLDFLVLVLKNAPEPQYQLLTLLTYKGNRKMLVQELRKNSSPPKVFREPCLLLISKLSSGTSKSVFTCGSLLCSYSGLRLPISLISVFFLLPVVCRSSPLLALGFPSLAPSASSPSPSFPSSSPFLLMLARTYSSSFIYFSPS